MTKLLFNLVVLAVPLLSGLVGGSFVPAKAETFKFSYDFLSGESLSGTVEGDLLPDNNTVSFLRNLDATYSGMPESQLTFVPSFGGNFLFLDTSDFSFYGFVNDPNTLIEQPNFGFSLGNPFVINGANVGTFSTSSSFIRFPLGSNQVEADPFSLDRWHVSRHEPVPEPSMILGSVVAGATMIVLRRKHAKSSQTEP